MRNPDDPVHEELERLPKETLIELIKMYSRNWHTCDGLWFSGVEERYGTDKALEIDLNIMETTNEMAAKIAEKSPLGSKCIKSVVKQAIQAPVDVVNDLAFSVLYRIAFTKDRAEGVRAFAEKRKPRYTGE